MSMRRGLVIVLSLVALCGAGLAGAQLRYWSGQNVVPVFEGWERDSDGTFRMVFGYYNRNYEETLDIPIGPNNSIEPGGPDQGQPTFFGPGRHKYVFWVKVPPDWDRSKRLVWALTIRGKTEKANAFLLPEWESNDQVMMMNSGGNVNSTAPNAAPRISASADQTVASPHSATLTVTVTDDGLPKPRVPRGARAGSPAPGPMLRVDWLQFRGPAGGTANFAPRSSPVVNGHATTQASFSAPGTYTIRGFANDGALTASADITVTVAPDAARAPR